MLQLLVQHTQQTAICDVVQLELTRPPHGSLTMTPEHSIVVYLALSSWACFSAATSRPAEDGVLGCFTHVARGAVHHCT